MADLIAIMASEFGSWSAQSCNGDVGSLALLVICNDQLFDVGRGQVCLPDGGFIDDLIVDMFVVRQQCEHDYRLLERFGRLDAGVAVQREQLVKLLDLCLGVLVEGELECIELLEDGGSSCWLVR